MKKILSLVLCVVLLSAICLTSVACNISDLIRPKETTPEGTTAQTTPEQNNQEQPVQDQNAKDYDQAFKLIEEGNYEAAYALFVKLGDYKDAKAEAAKFQYVPVKNTFSYTDDGETEVSSTITVVFGENGLPAYMKEVSDDGFTHTCNFTYNELGQTLCISCKYSDGMTETTDYIYDENGNLLREFHISPDGIISIYRASYNENGQIEKAIMQDTDGFLFGTESIYDENGREIQVLVTSMDQTTVTTNIYDENDLLVKTIERDENGNENVMSEYFYDEKGNLIKSTYERLGYSVIIEYTFDENGLKTSEYYEDSVGYRYTYNYTYDANGNCIKMHSVTSDSYESIGEIEYKLVYIPSEYSSWDLENFIYSIVNR